MTPLLLAGPTAVGKSHVALLLAEQLGGEIVSVDSMQVYRGLDIGTAKPSAAERERIPHHLIDVVEVTEAFDAARFISLAREAVTAVSARGKVPILCGGTGLYFKAFLAGLGDAPPTSPALRTELQASPLHELLRELAARDPETYARIDQKNPRRVIRAVEIIRLTGKPVERAAWNVERESAANGCAFGLSRPSGDLRRRIDVRVDEMFRLGLVAETERLLEHGLAQNPAAMQALGYRQVAEHLRSHRSLAETIELVKIRTRQFAKRQMTWFKRQMRLSWLNLAQSDSPADSAIVIGTEWKEAQTA
jgi:tRNA dimethylallyltransferase